MPFIEIGVNQDLKTDGNIGLNQEQNLSQTYMEIRFLKTMPLFTYSIKMSVSIRDPSFGLHYRVAMGITGIIYMRQSSTASIYICQHVRINWKSLPRLSGQPFFLVFLKIYIYSYKNADKCCDRKCIYGSFSPLLLWSATECKPIQSSGWDIQ